MYYPQSVFCTLYHKHTTLETMIHNSSLLCLLTLNHMLGVYSQGNSTDAKGEFVILKEIIRIITGVKKDVYPAQKYQNFI